MNRSVLFLFLIIMLLGIAILNNKKENQVCFKKHCFSVELAETSAERSKGLMFREQLDEDKGMLFVFPAEQEASFWMKNTLIPLDIIWFNENKEVLFIKKDAQPCGTDKCLSINSGVEAQYILELNAGVADEIGLIIGDKAIFDFTVSADSL